MPLTEEDIQAQLLRRRPGQSKLTTPRNEPDTVRVLSGTELGFTLGTPIGLFVANKDHNPSEYVEEYPRPSHADMAYLQKYGIKASSGGGRSSARETIARVAAGAIAEKYLSLAYGIEIVAFTSAIGKVTLAMPVDLYANLTRAQVDASLVRCPDEETSQKMIQWIDHVREQRDSTGGIVTCVIRNVPSGLGEPCFDKLEAKLAHAMLSIPATKGFEIGAGFHCTELLGSEHNDRWITLTHTETNNSGGIQGGISNGETIYFRVAFKPAATIEKPQDTIQYNGVMGTLEVKGRHDPCVVPRAIPIVEAMAALVIMDAVLQQNARRASVNLLPPSIVASIPKKLHPWHTNENSEIFSNDIGQ